MGLPDLSSRLWDFLENRRFVILRCTLQLHFPMGLAAGETQLSASNDGVVRWWSSVHHTRGTEPLSDLFPVTAICILVVGRVVSTEQIRHMSLFIEAKGFGLREVFERGKIHAVGLSSHRRALRVD